MVPVNYNLDGRVAIVTGAAGIRGMGRAIALTLASAGADVAVCDLYADKVGSFDLEGTANEIRKLGRRSIAVKTDITNINDVNNLVDTVVKELGTVDILVNNAGFGVAEPLLQLTLKTWNKVMDINLKGCFLCCQAAGKIMVKQKRGVIVNIASTSGRRGSPSLVPYGTSKAGVISFTRAAAQELAPYGIRVNGIAPGPTVTDMPSHVAEGGPVSNDEMITKMREQVFGGNMGLMVPLGRYGLPSDIANVTLFLCSDASGYVTGETLAVDGGLIMGNFPPPPAK